MIELPRDEVSYWRDTAPESSFPSLKKNLHVGVVIVGGGICGLTAAYILKQSGVTVAVLEKSTVGSGTTGHTTGKVTSQHGLVYQNLETHLGRVHAQAYAEANQAAIQKIVDIIHKEKLQCGWQRKDNYVFTSDSSQIQKFKDEARVAMSFGLPASYEEQIHLPVKVKAAIKFSGQATMHVQKYIYGLAQAVVGDGSYVFEHSKALWFKDGTPASVKTKHGAVTASDVIVATNTPTSPLFARGAYCILEYPVESHVVAVEVDKDYQGMYISPDDQHYSILPVSSENNRLLLIAGKNNIRGLSGSRKYRHQQLANYAKEVFDAKQVTHRWSAWDYLAYDDVPLVGKLYPWSQHTYVATAFKKWGLTNATAAAMILAHTIQGGEHNQWTSTYSSRRISPIMSIPRKAMHPLR